MKFNQFKFEKVKQVWMVLRLLYPLILVSPLEAVDLQFLYDSAVQVSLFDVSLLDCQEEVDVFTSNRVMYGDQKGIEQLMLW